AELFSSYLYLSMSAHFEAANLSGLSQWFRVQAQEELAHSVKFFDYVNERGGRVLLQAVEAPPQEWPSPIGAFEAVLEHEQKVTGLINDLMDVAIETRDHAARSFLQWFVDEQVEEESTVEDILAKLKLVGGDGHGLYMINQELGQRVFVLPPGLDGAA
ncbi:MAG: ferritin, partial [Proteobacteria bacterium]|nr:ferritin [Pseudomonadota bacterium]